MTDLIRRRTIFFVGGYDPKSPDAFFARLGREMDRFRKLWGIESSVSSVSVSEDGAVGTVSIESGEGTGAARWTTSTEFNFLVLDSLVLADFARPLPVRLAKYLAAFADFVITGTAFRMFAKAWRFGLYFLFPFGMILLFALAGWLAGRLAAPWLGWSAALVGLGVFAAAQAVLGRRWPVNHLMDLWSFSSAFIRGRRPDAEALMQRFARALVERTRQSGPHELVLVGHSTGGLLILDIAARALKLDPELAVRIDRVAILTLGSTALKAGLHPAARTFRDGVRRLSDDGRIAWIEVQCLTDVINFYKSNPVADMGLPARPDFPLVRKVRMKEMLEDEAYRRIRRNFFRVHYQYIFGNTKRFWYDFFQICCGPVPLMERGERRIVGAMESAAE